MENMRIMKQGPVFQYKGLLMSALLYYKGNSSVVHSWDITVKGLNLSKALPDERAALGIYDNDMRILNERIQREIDATQ